MRGACSIKGCLNNEAGKKLHEFFEGLEGINLCWGCGSKILDYLQSESKSGANND